MRGKLIVFPLIAVLSNAAYAGDIFRCVAANGDVMFTNMACPANSRVEHVASYEPVPNAPAATYSAPAAAVSAAPARDTVQQARAAYQAGYEQAQAEAQREQSSDESEYAPAWISFFPRIGSNFHDHHNHHPRQAMAAHSPHAQGTEFVLRH